MLCRHPSYPLLLSLTICYMASILATAVPSSLLSHRQFTPLSKRSPSPYSFNKPFHASLLKTTTPLVTRKFIAMPLVSVKNRKHSHHICRSGSGDIEKKSQEENNGVWTTSILLFFLWAGLLYYVIFLAPDQTKNRDFYFVEKLMNLKGDDGFKINSVLESLWYIMGLWPLVYSMLLLPSGRSSRSKVPVWPFLVLSMIGGAYALIPYFILWRPPPPSLDEAETKALPFKIFDSRVTAVILLIGGLVLITNSVLAGGDAWAEFFQYFRESKLVHATSVDFLLLSSFSTFWVFNDMTARKWYEKGKWILPLTLIPFIGPSLYLTLRPPVSSMLDSKEPKDS